MSQKNHEAFDQPPLNISLTVAICTRNRVEFLEKAIASVTKQLFPGVELLIIDNASTDTTPEVALRAAASHSSVRYLREERLGLSAARNTALKCAAGEYLLFLDDDGFARDGWLKNYFNFIREHSGQKIGCIGGTVFPAYEGEPASWFSRQWFELDYGGPTRRLESGSPWGCNIAFHKCEAIALGAFDLKLGRRGNFSGAYEESDLIRRLREANWEIWWLADAPIDHFIPARRTQFKTMLRERFQSGRSTALIRLAGIASKFRRGGYRFLRACVELLQCFLNCFLVAGAFLMGRKRKAAERAFKIARSAGLGYQLLVIKEC